jgi:hypothetical protein
LTFQTGTGTETGTGNNDRQFFAVSETWYKSKHTKFHFEQILCKVRVFSLCFMKNFDKKKDDILQKLQDFTKTKPLNEMVSSFDKM